MQVKAVLMILVCLALGTPPGFAQDDDVDIIEKTLAIYGVDKV